MSKSFLIFTAMIILLSGVFLGITDDASAACISALNYSGQSCITGQVCPRIKAPTGGSTGMTIDVSTSSSTFGGGSCSWPFSSNSSWLVVTNPSGGTGQGNAALTFNVDANSGSTARSGMLTLDTMTVWVDQDGSGGGGGACTYSITPTSQTVPASGGAASVMVVPSSEGCRWFVETSSSWITLAGKQGTGTNQLNFTVDPNPGATSRTGTIVVSGQSVTVVQLGVGDPGCTYTLSPTSQSFTSSGGSGSFAVTVGANCSWGAASNSAWITVTSGATGSGNGAVSFAVTANGSTSARSGAITVGNQVFSVTQDGVTSGCTFSIDPAGQSFTATGGSGSVTVAASQASCRWTVTSDSAWLALPGTSGTGNGLVNFSVAANPGSGSRIGTLNIAGHIFTVVQAGTGSCTFGINPTNQSFLSGGGTGTIAVTPPATGCSTAWTATTAESWISITSGANGQGSGSVGYSVAANGGANPRSGVIVVAGQLFTVTQSGASNCTINLSPTTETFQSPGGNGTVSISALSACMWTATPSDPWITVTSGASGSGSGSLSYAVAPNSQAGSRTGTISVSGATFTILQLGTDGCTLTLKPSAQTVSSAGGTLNISVAASQASCRWTVTSEVAWITLPGTSGTGDGVVTYTVATHNGTTPRNGVIRVGGVPFTVTQSGTPDPCIPIISPTHGYFSVDGGAATINVTMPWNRCQWTASENTNWISIVSGATGSGSGSVTVAVSSNSYSGTRSETISIAGQPYTVMQAGVDHFYLKVVKAGSGAGLIESTPAGIRCASDCAEATGIFANGTSVTLTVTPDQGSSFVNWTGGVCGGGGPCKMTVIENRTVTANLDGDSCSATLSNQGRLHIPCLYAFGTSSYWVDMAYLPGNAVENLFNITSYAASNYCLATLANDGTIHIPCLKNGTGVYAVELSYLPSPDRFTVSKVEQGPTAVADKSCAATLMPDGSMKLPCLLAFGKTHYWLDLGYAPGNDEFTPAAFGEGKFCLSTLDEAGVLTVPCLKAFGTTWYWMNMMYVPGSPVENLFRITEYGLK